MRKAQHTPGPWQLSEAGKQGLFSTDGGYAITAEDKHIAFVTCQTKFKRGEGYKAKCGERDANARLIAAAPELLDALETLLNAVNGNHVTVGDCNQAEHAIAKAKGE